jgi:uncharacterized protein (DUF983 family)
MPGAAAKHLKKGCGISTSGRPPLFFLSLLTWMFLLMETATNPSTLRSILQQRCPRCRMGRIFRHSIFRGFPKMQERCAVCDLKFEREPGYFLGAMYISYGLGVLIMAPIAVLLWFLTGWRITKVTLWAVVLFLPFAPTITLFARVLWIYFDQSVDPERQR